MSEELTPITRIEEYLDAIVDGGTPPLEDITRVETFLDAIYNNTPCALTPVTRIEMYLGKISGQDIALPEPVTRVEMYLASIAGMDVVLPDEPVTRIEMYLAEWANGSNIPWETLSGAIVSFIAPRSHALKEVVVDIEPQQDLHGYDAPWPAGGGKNLLPNTASTETKNGVKFTVQSDTSIKVENTASANTAFIVGSTELQAGTYILSGIADGVDNDFYIQLVNEAQTSQIAFSYNGDKQFTLSETRVVVFRIFVRNGVNTNGKVIYPMIRLSSVADGTFAPYANICPISGWTGANVQRTGKNVLDTSGILPASIKWANFAAFPIDQKVFQRATEENITIKLLGSLGTGKTQFALYIYDTVNNNAFYVGHSQNLTEDNNYTLTGLVTVGGSGIDITKPLTLRIYAQPYTGDEASEITGVMISFGTDTDYHAYQGNTYAIDWTDEAGTVYGGKLTVNEDGSAEIKGTEVYALLNDADEWYEVASNPKFRCSTDLSDRKKYNNSYDGLVLCSYIQINVSEYTNTGRWVGASSNNFGIESSALTLAQIKQDATAGKIAIVYELATPITIPLTAQQVITALQGYNNVWADCGDVTVTFRGTPVVEPDEQPLQALNLLLGGAYRNNQTQEDVPDEEALDILLGGADR